MAAAFLTRFPLSKFIPLTKLRRVLKSSEHRQFRTGERVFSKADPAKHMFVVESGKIKIFSSSGSKKRKTFAYLGRGDFFGEMALIDSTLRSASAQAVQDCKLIMISDSAFKDLLLAHPKLCYFLLETLSRRLRVANEQIESLLFSNILSRVAKVLFDLGRKEQISQTRQDLADLVGTTREPLSRALATLKRADAIAFDNGGRISIRDLARLGKMGGVAADDAAVDPRV